MAVSSDAYHGLPNGLEIVSDIMYNYTEVMALYSHILNLVSSIHSLVCGCLLIVN